MEIITGDDLASYPGVDGSLTTAQLEWVAEQVSALVEGAWQCPVEPVPAWVKAIALNAGGRFAQNPKGLESWTRSIDDASRTERVRGNSGTRSGIYLSDNDLAALSCADLPSGVGTIRTWPPHSSWCC